VTAILPVPGEPTATIQPCDRALNDPALRFDDEAFDGVATFDDFDLQVWHDARDADLEDRTIIGAVCEQLPQERELSKQGGDQQHTAVAVLNVSGGYQRVQQQTEFVDENVALFALDQLASIEAGRVDGRAPFSALFTLWLSRMQAVGLASRVACSRHFM
jgi:hypothetical protein